MLVHGSYASGSGGSCPSPKGHPVDPVVLLVPPVLAIARQGQADLVALVHDQVPLVRSRLVAVVDDGLLHAWANVVVGHLNLLFRIEINTPAPISSYPQRNCQCSGRPLSD